MSQTLHIVISDNITGDTILGIKETCPKKGKNASKTLKTLLAEPYLISRLIDDARRVIELNSELNKNIA